MTCLGPLRPLVSRADVARGGFLSVSRGKTSLRLLLTRLARECYHGQSQSYQIRLKVELTA